MKREKYLPIGSVCLLENATRKVMITGFAVKMANNNTFDYMGCIYPEGVISTNEVLLFNHDQIVETFFIGYETDEETEFKKKLNEFLDKQNDELGILGAQQNTEEI